MQSIDARKEYKHSFECATKIVKSEGFFTLWSGAVPRLARLILSGGIVFTMYEWPSVSVQQMLTLTGMKKQWRDWID